MPAGHIDPKGKWTLVLLGLGGSLVFFGILAFIITFFENAENSASVGVVIFIGPFPLIFGAGHNAELLIFIGVLTVAFGLILTIILRKKMCW
jgi:uncharacterized membrane protein